MQEDMHFYGVYALARSAGINAETARIIAYASQFVDDAIFDEEIILPDQRAILPTMTSHKPIDYQNTIPGDQWRVWVPFHFLPGNQSESGTFIEKMVCRKDSYPARRMLRNAVDPRNNRHWPYLIGIAAHVYADTFAHFGFIGIAHPWNRVKSESIVASNFHSASILQYIKAKFEDFKTRFASDFAEMIPVGHGPVATYPDRPYLKWRFEYEDGSHDPADTDRDNVSHFLEGCKGLYDFFYEYSRRNPYVQDSINPRGWDSISRNVERILGRAAPREERIRSWKEAISSGQFCHVTEVDRKIRYDPDLWKPREARGRSGENSDPHRFFRAAWSHRNYVLHELLPEIGLLL
jgi:hypothetical protein